MIKVGDIFETKNYGKCEVIEYKNTNSIIVRFNFTGFITEVRSGNLRDGSVKDRRRPSVCGVGYAGVGKYSNKLNKDAYITWRNMMGRCYSEKVQQKQPTYIGCTVCDEWHDFQSFADWYYKNHPMNGNEMQLDKDLKINGNKVYSPNACLFVSREVNSFITDRSGDVIFHKGTGKFRARCGNPLSGEREHLGLFDSERKAYAAWRKRKSEICYQLAICQDSTEVTNALLKWKCVLDSNSEKH